MLQIQRFRRLAAMVAVVSVIAAACGDDAEPAAPTTTLDEPACTSIADDDLSVARIWNEAALDAVRRDFPAPTVHARNLFHLSVAMWDTWAAFDAGADGHLVDEIADLPATELDTAISAAAHRLLSTRYDQADGAGASLNAFDETLWSVCGDPTDPAATPASAFGVAVADAVLAATAADGADDPGSYEAVNPPLYVPLAYTSMADPNRWQPLEFVQQFSQTGQAMSATVQEFVSPHWGSVTPFALDGPAPLPIDPGDPPYLTGDPETDAVFVDAAVEVLRYSATLDPTDGVTIDIGPGAWGDSTLGTDDGTGHRLNPATAEPYDPNEVLAADYGRVVAEFWADGPDSETPPGHWNTLANEISDALAATGDLRIGGLGDAIDRLQWDVKLYLALNGATHDAAVAAWGAKEHYDYVRPISMIRYLAGLGQSSDPTQPNYHPQGLPLTEGLVRLGPGDEIEVRTWQGAPDDPQTETSGVGWIRGGEWVPYQQPTFVTPAFAGYVSGHSTFSRAAAEVLTAFTGDPYFPGGIGEWTIAADSLHFESGPTTDITLQWATYRDAADQAGFSRLYGGIHVWADDYLGREMGAEIGDAAWAAARDLF
ncbi:MAG: vanadium-dependent haloperoxidase [Actinomycetota bacterium]